MDKLFYKDDALTKKTSIPLTAQLPDVYFELIEIDLKELKDIYGLTLYDIEWTTEGITTDLELAKVKIARKEATKALKAGRNKQLSENKVTINGHLFDARPADLANIQLGIQLGKTKWITSDEYYPDVVTVTQEELTQLLTEGTLRGETIWDEYKDALELLQN